MPIHLLRSMSVVFNERLNRGMLRKKAPDFIDIFERYEKLLGVSRDPDAEFGENIRDWIDGIVRQDFAPAGLPGLCKR
ncbi:MAG: hypothetical protein ABIJ56_21635 [Pseudomonadota bacterium]